jgi:hypothetical protein
MDMDIQQDLLRRIGLMGFEEVTERYNMEHQTNWRFVFTGPIPECWCEDEEALLWLYAFLKGTLGLKDKEAVSSSL